MREAPKNSDARGFEPADPLAACWLRIEGGIDRCRRIALGPAGLIILVALAASLPYAGVLDAPFVFDDTKLVRDNELLRVEGREALDRFVAAFDITSDRYADEEVRENYRPLRFISYWVDYQLARAFTRGFDPARPPVFFFHLQNILWHAANALLVLWIGGHLFRSRAVAFVLALLFALHPLQTEAVTYISGRRDVLSTFFFLLALALYVRRPADQRLGFIPAIAVPASFAVGLYAKEMVISLPAVLFAFELVRRPRLDVTRVACHVLLWIIAGLFIYATVSNESLIAAPVGGSGESTFLTIPRYIARYLGLVLLPISQSIDYSFDAIPPSTSITDPPTTLLSILLVVALSGWTLFAILSRRRLAAWGIAWFLVALTPVLQIVPIPERFAERFAYLPSIGALIGLVALALPVVRRLPRRAPYAVAAVVMALLIATVARNHQWRSALALWESATEAQPRAARAWLAYGNELKDAGRLDEAANAYSLALSIYDESPQPTSLQHGQALQARMFRGGVYSLLGRRDPRHLEKAKADLTRVLESTDTDGTVVGSSPRYAVIRHELASVLFAMRRFGEARAEFEKIIAIGEPAARVAEACYWIGKIELIEEDLEEAVEWFERAVRALPRGDRALFDASIELADLLSNLADDHEQAWQILEDLLRQGPDEATRVGILLRRAKILDRKREIGACLEELERALSIDPRNLPVLMTLAGIEANLGRDEKAREHYAQALALDPRNLEAREALKAMGVRRAVEAKKSQDEKNEEILRGLYNRGDKHRLGGEWLAARETFSELLRAALYLGHDEGFALACCELASIEERLGRMKIAERYLSEAERRLPKRPETLLRSAGFHLRRGSDAAVVRSYALRYLESLPKEETPSPDVHVYLAEISEERDPRAAIEHLVRARALVEGAGDSERALAIDRRIGHLHVRLGEWQPAYDVLQRFVERTEDPLAREEVIELIQGRVIPALLDDLDLPEEIDEAGEIDPAIEREIGRESPSEPRSR